MAENTALTAPPSDASNTIAVSDKVLFQELRGQDQALIRHWQNRALVLAQANEQLQAALDAKNAVKGK